ncbi:gp357 [Bacillus phage G]|uniref:Gp357 n=1 Tax=Bacillus phage G TaxID=2884420 RepID=G3MA98_9CAUD|nr:gp357 [Bacillus phage G]AEO93616.1 gp357 [Bacillus phage G]
MNLINKETIQQILSFYPDESKELIKHQINAMEEIIKKQSDLYTKDKGYQRAVDYILKQIIEGKFILK